MRAIYYPGSFNEKDSVIISNESAHHLINVIRIKKNSEILLLGGKGSITTVLVLEVRKKEVVVEVLRVEKFRPKLDLDLGVGLVKKEALDLILKQACELGFNKIILLESEYSQRYKLNTERIQRLLISGVEQSNNPFLPKIEFKTLKELNWQEYGRVYFYSSYSNEVKMVEKISSPDLLLIGPEGGFSQDEENEIKKISNLTTYKLETYIMRTSTAVGTCLGHYLGINN